MKKFITLLLIVSNFLFISGFSNIKKNGDNVLMVNNEKIYYERSGNKHSEKTIIFIHGAFVNSDTMKFLSKEFKNYNCITFDLPAHGKSEGTPKTVLSDYTESVYQFIKLLKDKKEITNNITLVGWSMGGSISLELAEKGLKGLQNVILLDSSSKWTLDTSGMNPNAPINLKPLFASEFTNLTPQYVRDVFDKDYNKYIASDTTIISDVMAVCTYDNISNLNKITVPVLAISGDSDNLATLENEALLKRNINKCYIKIYPNRGHQMFMEIPNEISRDIKEFFEYSK
jgi:pimeloyl-ACP methyl ester carboxylesterase